MVGPKFSCQYFVKGKGDGDGGQLFQPFRLGRIRLDLANFGEKPRRLRDPAGGFVAAGDVQRAVRVNRRQAIGFVQFPAEPV